MPRRADGVWVDANGEVVYRSDPNDTGIDKTKATYRDGFWYDNKTGEKIPNKNDMPQRVPGTKAGEPGSTTWPDGTPVTPEQHAEINKQAGGPGEGGQQPGWVDAVLGVVSGGMIPTVQGFGSVINASQGKPSSFWAGNLPGQTTGSEPSEGAPNYGITGFADPSGATNSYLSPEAPGGELDTRQPDADRQRMADYLAQLQGQAQTGGGAWEGQLAQATQQGTAASTALGQSVAGIDAMTAQRNIGNASAGVQQRAAGQAETLRAQTKQQAQDQLSGIYSAQGSLDAQQAAEQAAARQGRREANQAITDEANKTNAGIYSGVAQGVMSLLSEGGPVPGKAQVFGDDTANDTVPAMLSPGEIVLPRSVTNSSDPASAAAAFVQAVKEHHGAQNYDNGGQVPKDPWATKPDTDAGDALPELANDPTVTDAGNARFMGIGTPQQAASVRNGGLLDTTAYNASREATLGSTQAFLDAFGGRGPSVAPQLTRTSTDENIAGAMAAQAGARGAGRQAAAGLIGGQAAAGQGEIAGRAAGTAAQEATQGGQSYAAAIQKQRQMDLAFALAQQQAMWRNSMLNAGIGLASQAQMRGVLGGVGQAFAAGANALGNSGKDFDGFGADPEAQAAGDEWDTDISPGSAEGDWNTDSPSWDSDTGTAYAAHGGEIRDRAFTRAAGYADGGSIGGLDAGTELAGPRDAGVLQAPPFTASVQPPVPMPVAAPLAPPRPGLPMAAPRAQPRSMQAAPAAPDAFALEQQAVEAEGAANEEAGRAKAEALIGAQKAIERAGIERQEAHARAKMSADADMARILEARQALTASSSTVDPGRWWASRSVPGKIAAAIGLALGAIGAGNDGVNRSVGIIENAIGRDLEAQKAEHQIRMRQGQMGLESAMSIYSMHRQLADDDIGAMDAAKATALEIAKNQIDIAGARASSPLAKAQQMALSAQIAQKRDAFNAAAKQRSFDNRLKIEDSQTRRLAALKESASQAGRDFVAPGYKLMPGATPKVEELGKWRDALAEKRNTDATTKKLKDLINKSSFTPLGEDAAQAQSLISDLKVSYKNMATLGALSGSDYALIDAAIPDPTSLKGHFTPDKTLNSRLDQFAKTAAVKLDNKASVLGVVKADEAEGAGGGRRIVRNRQTGEQRYLNADGSLGEIAQ